MFPSLSGRARCKNQFPFGRRQWPRGFAKLPLLHLRRFISLGPDGVDQYLGGGHELSRHALSLLVKGMLQSIACKKITLFPLLDR